MYIRDSLGSVVVNGWPPEAKRICSRVSLNSLLEPLCTATAAAAGVVWGALLIGVDCPSRRAFSRAAFSARAFLSASICALTAARARASSIFSERLRI